MKKILIVNNLLGFYGAENVLKNLVNHMDSSQYHITVLTLNESNAELLSDKVEYKYVFKRGDRLINKIKLMLGYRNLAKLYCKDYDIGIAFKMGECAKLIGESNCKKKYCWIHSNVSALNEPQSYGYRDIEEEKEILKKFDSLIAVSEACKKSFECKYGKVSNIKVIKNPVDFEEIRKKSLEKLDDTEYKLLNSKNVIGTVARLDEEQKRISWLIQLSKKLDEMGVSHKMVVVGGGGDEKKYREMIENLSASNVVLLGFKNNPYKYLRYFKLFICTSKSESYSLVVNEAIALGIPVVSTRCGGPEEVLEYGKYGFLCDNDEKAVEKMVIKLLVEKPGDIVQKYNAENSLKVFINEVIELFNREG